MVVDFDRLFDTILEHDKRLTSLERPPADEPKTIFSFTEKDKEKMLKNVSFSTREIVSAWLEGKEEDRQKYSYRGGPWCIAANYFISCIVEKIREAARANKG